MSEQRTKENYSGLIVLCLKKPKLNRKQKQNSNMKNKNNE